MTSFLLQDFEISYLKNSNTDLDKAPPPKRGIWGCINGVYLRFVTGNGGLGDQRQLFLVSGEASCPERGRSLYQSKIRNYIFQESHFLKFWLGSG